MNIRIRFSTDSLCLTYIANEFVCVWWGVMCVCVRWYVSECVCGGIICECVCVVRNYMWVYVCKGDYMWVCLSGLYASLCKYQRTTLGNCPLTFLPCWRQAFFPHISQASCCLSLYTNSFFSFSSPGSGCWDYRYFSYCIWLLSCLVESILRSLG